MSLPWFIVGMLGLAATAVGLLIWSCIAVSTAMDWPLYLSAIVMTSASVTLFAAVIAVGEVFLWLRRRRRARERTVAIPRVTVHKDIRPYN